MENRVKDGNYYVVQGFMVKDLELKGLEKDVYAIIYGFSQAENQTFTGSLQYLADWTNSSKQGILKCLNSLIEKGLIAKKENVINNVKFVEYYSTEFNGGIKQSLTGGIKQSLTNNIDYNNIVDIYNSKCSSLPKVETISVRRKQMIKARLKDYSIEQITKCFEMAEQSDFLKGKNDRGWTANFDWLMNDTNFCKVLDGNYNKSFNNNKAKANYTEQRSYTNMNELFDDPENIEI